MWMKVKKVHPDAIIPERAHDTDAGMDIFAIEDAIIHPQEDHLFALGWACAIPKGYALIVKEKSGRAVKDKLDVGACVIDSSYRGEVHCHLFNNHPVTNIDLGYGNVHIKKGEKIAQLVMVQVWDGKPEEVEELDETKRGEGAFGSSGLVKKV